MSSMRIAPLVAAAVLALVACGGVAEERSATPRQAAPTITGTTVDGRELSLEEFRGKPLMVNAWASW
jgi:cytochrome c biogenesis protein CcmG, thiol:disulfide interchange protein DsbE